MTRAIHQAQPLVGLILDYETSGSFSPRPHDALRRNYFQAVAAAGGLPVGLPADADLLPALLARVDAVLIPGGSYPSPGAWYRDDPAGEPPPLPAGQPPHPRVTGDPVAIRHCLEQDKPLLAICAGMQAFAVELGAAITRDVCAIAGTRVAHRASTAADQRSHGLMIEAGSRLAALWPETGAAGPPPAQVNSFHREAIREAGPHARVSARCPEDGVIEAIEAPGQRFAIGVQWHPEFFFAPGEPDRRLFEGLLAAVG